MQTVQRSTLRLFREVPLWRDDISTLQPERKPAIAVTPEKPHTPVLTALEQRCCDMATD